MIQKESVIQSYLLKEINKFPKCKAVNIHGNEFIEIGTPDIIGCWDGSIFLIEVKRADGRLSKIQERRLEEWGDVGADVFAVYGMEGAVDFLSRLGPQPRKKNPEQSSDPS